MQIDRRRLIRLGALALAPTTGGAASSATPSGPSLGTMVLCNTPYHAGEEAALAAGPGAPLDVRFAFDPAFVDEPSAQFHLNGLVLGDAPRRCRRWMGRLLNAGCRLRGQVVEPLPEMEHRPALVRVRVDLAPGPPGEPLGRPIADGFMEAEARVIGGDGVAARAGAGRPVFLAAAYVEGAVKADAAVGEALRLAAADGDGRRRAGVIFEAWNGRRVGELWADFGPMARALTVSGARLVAVTLPGPPWNDQLWTAIYLAGSEI